MKKFDKAFCLAAIAAILSSFASAQANDSVNANVSVDVPSIVNISGTDGVTTSQDLLLNQSNISFDSALNASGGASITWRANTNSNNGLKVTIQRSALSGTASSDLQNDLQIMGSPAPGGDVDATIMGSYSAGVKLPAISEGKPEDFMSTSKSGASNFNVDLKLNAPSSHGRGSVKTVLTFVAAAL